MTYSVTVYEPLPGAVYWHATDQVVMGYDPALGLVGLTTRSSVPSGTDADRLILGPPSLWGTGELMIPAHSDVSGSFPNVQYGTTTVQDGFTVSRALDPSGAQRWLTPWNSWWGVGGIPGHVYSDFDTGVYDPTTGLNWWARTYGTAGDPATYQTGNGNGEPTPPFLLYAYDNDGNYVQGVGHSEYEVNQLGDAFTGAGVASPTNVSAMDRWLYRNLTYNDGVARYNLDTGVYEASLYQLNPAGDRQICAFIGVNDVEGTYVTAHRDTGFIEIRDPNESTWKPMPAVRGLEANDNPGDPIRAFDPQLDPGTFTNLYSTSYARTTHIHAGRAYYFATYGYTGVLGEPAYALLSMDLSDGSITKHLDIPLVAFDEYGVMTENESEWYYDSGSDPSGLLLVTSGTSVITGRPLDTRRAFGDA